MKPLITQEEEIAFEDEMIELRRIEREYNQYERPKVAENIKLFLEEFPADEKRRIRLRLLTERMRRAKKEKDITNLRLYVDEYRILMGLSKDIRPEDIIRARNYPIQNFVKTNRNGMASCPFHKDRTPSMDVRKNFYYCYSCNASGDVIDLAEKMNGWSFKEAVEKLQ